MASSKPVFARLISWVPGESLTVAGVIWPVGSSSTKITAPAGVLSNAMAVGERTRFQDLVIVIRPKGGGVTTVGMIGGGVTGADTLTLAVEYTVSFDRLAFNV